MQTNSSRVSLVSLSKDGIPGRIHCTEERKDHSCVKSENACDSHPSILVCDSSEIKPGSVVSGNLSSSTVTGLN